MKQEHRLYWVRREIGAISIGDEIECTVGFCGPTWAHRTNEKVKAKVVDLEDRSGYVLVEPLTPLESKSPTLDTVLF